MAMNCNWTMPLYHVRESLLVLDLPWLALMASVRSIVLGETRRGLEGWCDNYEIQQARAIGDGPLWPALVRKEGQRDVHIDGSLQNCESGKYAKRG